MIAKIIPVILILVGAGAGIAAGFAMRPSEGAADETAAMSHAAVTTEFVKLNNQFVVPVLKEGRVSSMVILSLSLEVTLASTEAVYDREPKLRDAMLQVLFDHANAGGFEGVFTGGENLITLREALLEVAKKTLGELVKDVLISDISRQDS
ncbi:flagellar basal body-associated FliL family protein [Pseudorhodobacter sp.]|uniref:flagellar basal body-associated FliL family protein n=1 Tax=Pseudorhodobacter sp. TaxID=1934400 RepID=UPI0026478ED5|nr:flagellar basal body-associated FliL family protein [Pseudorhodobacter sp.]MDN5788065.1 flagellar basal body-associated FliL family protein [Pseudorhodobacter sp.]